MVTVTMRRPDAPAAPRYYEAVIKVNPTDDPEIRARDIATGIGYACALLHDEYGWSPERVEALLEQTTDGIFDDEARRG